MDSLAAAQRILGTLTGARAALMHVAAEHLPAGRLIALHARMAEAEGEHIVGVDALVERRLEVLRRSVGVGLAAAASIEPSLYTALADPARARGPFTAPEYEPAAPAVLRAPGGDRPTERATATDAVQPKPRPSIEPGSSVTESGSPVALAPRTAEPAPSAAEVSTPAPVEPKPTARAGVTPPPVARAIAAAARGEPMARPPRSNEVRPVVRPAVAPPPSAVTAPPVPSAVATAAPTVAPLVDVPPTERRPADSVSEGAFAALRGAFSAPPAAGPTIDAAPPVAAAPASAPAEDLSGLAAVFAPAARVGAAPPPRLAAADDVDDEDMAEDSPPARAPASPALLDAPTPARIASPLEAAPVEPPVEAVRVTAAISAPRAVAPQLSRSDDALEADHPEDDAPAPAAHDEGAFRVTFDQRVAVSVRSAPRAPRLTDDEASESSPPTPADVPSSAFLVDELRVQTTVAEAVQTAALGDFPKAIQLFTDALEMNPGVVDAHIGRGRCHLELGDYSSAMSDFQHAEDAAPDTPEPHVAMGDLYFARKEYKRAIDFYDQAVELDGAHPMARCRRGISHYYRKSYRQAHQDLQRALALDPDIPNIRKYVLMAARKLERPDA
jgi:hypothetical protein